MAGLLKTIFFGLFAALGALVAEPTLDVLKEQASAGDVAAQLQLAGRYDYGRGVKQNYKEAARWYAKAAETGDALAQNNLGSLYLNGLGLKKDYAMARQLFEKAAAQNQPDAMCSLGLMHDEGYGAPKNSALAHEWYRKAAELGNSHACYNVRLNYSTGAGGVAADHAEAFRWMEKAATEGFAPAQLKVGYALYNGIGASKDQTQAVAWYRKAATQGNVDAMANLGLAYRDGGGVPCDPIEAFAWLDLARFLTQRGANRGSKWGIRRELDALEKTLTATQKKAGNARANQLLDELRTQARE